MLISKKCVLLILMVTSCLLIDSTDAGWKFWKSKKEEPTSTTASPVPPTVTTASSSTSGPVSSDGIHAKDAKKAPGVEKHSPVVTEAPKPLQTSTKKPPTSLTGPDIALSPPQDPHPPARPLPNSQTHTPKPPVSPTLENPRRPSIPTIEPAHRAPTSTLKPTQRPIPSSGPTQKGPGPLSTPLTPIPQGTKPPATPTAAPRPTQRPAPTTKTPETSSRTSIYSKNPKYSPGNTVTNEDLEKLSEALYLLDNSNVWQHVSVNLQKKTTSQSLVDESPQPLLTVKPAALQLETVDKVRKIYDNYQLDTKTNEHLGVAQRKEETDLINKVLSTDLMSAAMRFLANKGRVRQNFDEYQALLRRLWFRLYSRGQGKIGSTGFEHVFLAEIRDRAEILGLHNWLYFSTEEQKGHVNYLGYMKQVKLDDKVSILKFHALFNGISKPVTSMFVGTSPELEMALYTVCFMVRPDGECPLSIGGTKFKINTYKFTYRGSNMIGSAYPQI